MQRLRHSRLFTFIVYELNYRTLTDTENALIIITINITYRRREVITFCKRIELALFSNIIAYHIIVLYCGPKLWSHYHIFFCKQRFIKLQLYGFNNNLRYKVLCIAIDAKNVICGSDTFIKSLQITDQ